MADPIVRPGTSSMEVAPEVVDSILARHDEDLGALISVLEEIQAVWGYLPEKALRMVAERTGRSLVDVYGVARFYKLFNLEPRGRHLVSVCLGTACHVRGGQAIAGQFEQILGAPVGETTKDGEFTLKTVNCLGACALGPVVVIDGRYFSKVRKSKVGKLVEMALNGMDGSSAGTNGNGFHVTVRCPSCNHSLMDHGFQIDGRACVRVTISAGRQHGWLRLSSVWGSYDVIMEHEVPVDTVAHFFCPHCHSELIGSWKCAMCGAPMVPMLVEGGGTIRICSRRGCTGSDGHMLDLA